MLRLVLRPSEVSDVKLGKLYEESFFDHRFGGFEMLIKERRNTMLFLEEFLELIPSLPCYCIWHSELESSWKKVQQIEFEPKLMESVTK